MTAYGATPTQDLFDLLVGRKARGSLPNICNHRLVRVALWSPEDGDQLRDPSTAIAIMSEALYVRLFPLGHHGPVVLDGGAS